MTIRYVPASRRCAPCRSALVRTPATLVSLRGRSGGASRLRFPRLLRPRESPVGLPALGAQHARRVVLRACPQRCVAPKRLVVDAAEQRSQRCPQHVFAAPAAGHRRDVERLRKARANSTTVSGSPSPEHPQKSRQRVIRRSSALRGILLALLAAHVLSSAGPRRCLRLPLRRFPCFPPRALLRRSCDSVVPSRFLSA